MIRHFSLSDLECILKIERQAFPKSPYDRITFLNLQWLYPETFLVYVEDARKSGEEKLWGYIIFREDGHIISVAVHPAMRRKGVGRRLLQSVIHHPHIKRIWAEVRRSNQGAQAFYHNLGFQVVGVVPNYYGDEDALIVQKIPPFL
jgi:ribosomal-protein-alanine N-acetyltransferase